VFVRVRCKSCEAQWVEKYELAGYGELEVPGKAKEAKSKKLPVSHVVVWRGGQDSDNVRVADRNMDTEFGRQRTKALCDFRAGNVNDKLTFWYVPPDGAKAATRITDPDEIDWSGL